MSPEIASTCYINAGDGTGYLPQDVCFPFRTLAAALPLPPPEKNSHSWCDKPPLLEFESSPSPKKKITVTDICPWLRLRFRVIELSFGNRG